MSTENYPPYVLWLPSWYPNKLYPFEGDFIQRHAKALSRSTNLTVIYVYQYGASESPNKDKIEVREKENFKEILISFSFLKTGLFYLDKLIYNLKYFSVCKKYLKKYFNENGVPIIVHAHVPIKAGLIAVWIKKKWDIPFIISEHSSHYEVSSPEFYDFKSGYYKRSVRKIFQAADIATNVSYKVAEKIKVLLKLNITISIVRNLADKTQFFYAGYMPEVFRFIHVSSLDDQQKNITGIISVFENLYQTRKDWQLWIIGPGNKNIISLLVDHPLKDHVIYKGEVRHGQVAQFMRQSSALVLFSRHENFPCVIVEALCCGLPIIVSNAGGAEEAVTKDNGLVVQSEDENGLLIALNYFLNNQQNYDRKQISIEAQAKYSNEVIAADFLALYKSILKEESGF